MLLTKTYFQPNFSRFLPTAQDEEQHQHVMTIVYGERNMKSAVLPRVAESEVKYPTPTTTFPKCPTLTPDSDFPKFPTPTP